MSLDLSSLVGKTVAGFRLTARLGEGGMAVVFAAENKVNAQIRRAIKIVQPELAARAEFRKRFSEEASIIEQLHHPNVVRFYGLREESVDGEDLLLMELELLDGETLADKMQKSPRLATRDVLTWFHGAAEGVAAAHELGIVHRDLKPVNLFLTKKGVVKVLDFGIARALDEADRGERLTRTGTLVGTAAYMAPEVCNGKTPTAAADVYALGVSLVELLLGHHPYAAPGEDLKSTPQMMFAHVAQPLPNIRAERADADGDLETVIQRATAKDPKDRYATARELADALRAMIGGETSAPTTPRTAPQPSGSLTNFALAPIDGTKKPASRESATEFALPTMAAAPAAARDAVPEAKPTSTPSRSPLLYAGAAVAVVAAVGAALAFRPQPPPTVTVVDAGPAPVAVVDAAPPQKTPREVLAGAAEAGADAPDAKAVDAALQSLAPEWKGKIKKVSVVTPLKSEEEILQALASASEGTAVIFAPGRYALDASLKVEGKKSVAVVGVDAEIFVRSGTAVLAVERSADFLLYGVYMNHHASAIAKWQAIAEVCSTPIYRPQAKSSNVVELRHVMRANIVQSELEGSGFIGVLALDSSELRIRDSKIHDCISEGIRLESSTADVVNTLVFKVGNRRFLTAAPPEPNLSDSFCMGDAVEMCNSPDKPCATLRQCTRVASGWENDVPQGGPSFIRAITVDKESTLAMSQSTVFVPSPLSSGSAFSVAGTLRLKDSVVVHDEGFSTTQTGTPTLTVEKTCISPPKVATTLSGVEKERNTIAKATFASPPSAADEFTSALAEGSPCQGMGAKLEDPVIRVHQKPTK